jgi:hypothetical protein
MKPSDWAELFVILLVAAVLLTIGAFLPHAARGVLVMLDIALFIACVWAIAADACSSKRGDDEEEAAPRWRS